jgi:hypothetical protein
MRKVKTAKQHSKLRMLFVDTIMFALTFLLMVIIHWLNLCRTCREAKEGEPLK